MNNKNKNYINSNDDEFKTMLDLFNNNKVADEIYYKDNSGQIFTIDGIRIKDYLGFGIYKVLKEERIIMRQLNISIKLIKVFEKVVTSTLLM